MTSRSDAHEIREMLADETNAIGVGGHPQPPRHLPIVPDEHVDIGSHLA